jgi:LmbE family N-acetylglucosaminyl deacetylase
VPMGPEESRGAGGAAPFEAKDFIPIPNLLAMRRVVAFAPHPDDLELGAGATLARLIREGAEVHWVIATDGSVGTTRADMAPAELRRIRAAEQEAAMAILGGRHLMWLGLPDMQLEPRRAELRRLVYRTIRALAPDIVMAPDPWLPYESHPDHRTLGLVVAEAASQCPFPHIESEAGPPVNAPAVAFYGTAWPNTFVDVTETFSLKVQALAAHQSQYPPPMDELIGFYSRTLAEGYGRERGVALAEAFKVLSPLHLHFNVDAWRS